MKPTMLASTVATAFSIFAADAHAWTVTTHGTISSGYDTTGVFGMASQDLTGTSYVESISSNTDSANWLNQGIYGDYVRYVNSGEETLHVPGPPFTTTVIVNGYTITFNSPSSTWGSQVISNGLSSGNGSYDGIESDQYQRVENSSYLYAYSWAYNDRTNFVQNFNFDQTLKQALDSSFNSGSYFYISNINESAYFNGTPNFLSLNSEVPEPTSFALLGLGLFAFAALRYKSANVKPLTIPRQALNKA